MTATGSPSHEESTMPHGHAPLCRAGGTATPGFSPSPPPSFSIPLANADGADTASYDGQVHFGVPEIDYRRRIRGERERKRQSVVFII
jgi:hypothetical protein